MNQPVRTLQETLGKKNPFDLPEQEAHINIVRLSHALESRELRFFKPYGLSPPGYNVLRILRSAGDPGQTCTGIRDDLISQVPDVTRLLDRLEKSGFVERRRCSEDRRVVYAAITEKGLDLLGELDEPVNELHKELLGHLGPDDLHTLNRLIDKARAGVERPVGKLSGRLGTNGTVNGH